MSYIKDNFEPISFDSQKMEIAGIACLRKIASLKISPKLEKFSYQGSILKNGVSTIRLQKPGLLRHIKR